MTGRTFSQVSKTTKTFLLLANHRLTTLRRFVNDNAGPESAA